MIITLVNYHDSIMTPCLAHCRDWRQQLSWGRGSLSLGLSRCSPSLQPQPPVGHTPEAIPGPRHDKDMFLRRKDLAPPEPLPHLTVGYASPLNLTPDISLGGVGLLVVFSTHRAQATQHSWIGWGRLLKAELGWQKWADWQPPELRGFQGLPLSHNSTPAPGKA